MGLMHYYWSTKQKCCCIPACSSTSKRESHLSLFGRPVKNKRLLKHWGCVIRCTNLPMNCHTQICSKHFVNAEGTNLHPDEVPLLTLPSNNWSLGNNWRQPSRYQFARLGDEPVTIVITVWFTRGTIERWSTYALRSLHGFPRVGNFPPFFGVGSSCFMP